MSTSEMADDKEIMEKLVGGANTLQIYEEKCLLDSSVSHLNLPSRINDDAVCEESDTEQPGLARV